MNDCFQFGNDLAVHLARVVAPERLELVRGEARFEAIVDGMPDAVSVRERDGRLVVTLKGGKSNIGWPEAKTFAQAICADMASDSPNLYLVNMAKRLRTGRIYLDYLRNDRGSTAVGAYCVRARQGLPVAMPLDEMTRRNLELGGQRLHGALDLAVRGQQPPLALALGERAVRAHDALPREALLLAQHGDHPVLGDQLRDRGIPVSL